MLGMNSASGLPWRFLRFEPYTDYHTCDATVNTVHMRCPAERVVGLAGAPVARAARHPHGNYPRLLGNYSSRFFLTVTLASLSAVALWPNDLHRGPLPVYRKYA